MKHRRKGRTLGRKAHHRTQLWQNLTTSLLEHGAVVTTEAKAKEFRTFVEPLLTKARETELTLHRRRQLLTALGQATDLERLLEVAGQHKDRHGGYVRLTRLPQNRSDGASLMRIELMEN